MQLNHTKVGFTKIGEIEIPENFFNRIKTGIDDIDMIFGDGILPGSVTTLISDPGVGKSIFCRTVLDKLQLSGYNVGYASGEEDIHQIAYSSLNLGIKNLQTATITDVDDLASAMDEFDALVIDSFQTLTTTKDLNSRAHVQYLTNTIVHNAKKHNCAVIVIVQKTSSGEIKGGTTLPFAVDLNIRILKDSDMGESFRLVEVYKNRFGKTGKYEMEMTDSGYVFKGVYIEPDAPEKTRKVPVSNIRKEAIMNMIEPPLITVERVMEELDIAHQTASILLRELTLEKQLVKYGRGADAIWKTRTPLQFERDETEQPQEHGAAVLDS